MRQLALNIIKQKTCTLKCFVSRQLLSVSLIFALLFSLFVPVASALTASKSTTTAFRNQIAKNWTFIDQGYYECNCLAWAVGITTAWLWPWGEDNPTLAEVDTYLTAHGYTAADYPEGYNIYAYGTANSICHFGKGRGYGPLAIAMESKWGHCELFGHPDCNPFYTIAEGGLYGKLQAYYCPV